ncbi:MAG: lanthionine synthetase LanC family protein [Ilumatobacter sp.]
MTDEALQHVLEVEAFLESCRVEGDAGSTWARVPGASASSRNTLYHGSAGVALFYIELHRATGDGRFLRIAVDGGTALVDALSTGNDVSIAIYSGLPGYVFVLNELAKQSGRSEFRDVAADLVRRMADQSSPLGSGIGWIEPIPFSDITGITGEREVLDLSIGAAGAGIGFLYAHRNGLHTDALDLARQTADRLIEMSVDGLGGPNWRMMADMPFPFDAPNFAHGAAGVAYFLADLHRATGEQRYLDVAIAAAGYVEAHTVESGDGHLVCHTDQNPGLFYLGVCHGPPGTGRLMYLLHEITGDDQWMDRVHANVRGMLATGAPETRSDGLWNNFGQCCGDAGIGDYALFLHRATGDPDYLELAQRVGAVIIDNSDVDAGRRSWTQAEHRSRPDFVETQTGYMQGAAGIASFLLHLATTDADIVAKIPLPDTPFTN